MDDTLRAWAEHNASPWDPNAQAKEAVLDLLDRYRVLTRAIERHGGTIFSGNFTLRDGSHTTLYVEFSDCL